MQKTLLHCLLFCLPFVAHAQDTTKVEQYCQVIAGGVLFTGKVVISVDYGEERRSRRSLLVREENGKLMRFNSVIDALNYLGRNGWKIVNAFPLLDPTGPKQYQYLFKKEVAVAELN
jgi:hypothetical protein